MPVFRRNYFKNGIGALTGRNTASQEIAIDSGSSSVSISDTSPGIRILNDTVYYEDVFLTGGGGIDGQPGNGGQTAGTGCGASALKFNQIHTHIGQTTNGTSGNAGSGPTSQNSSLFGYSSGFGNNGNRGNPPQPNPGPGNPGTSNKATFSNSQIQVARSGITSSFGGPQATPSLPVTSGGQRRLEGYPDNPTFSQKGDRNNGGAIWGSIPGINRRFRA